MLKRYFLYLLFFIVCNLSIYSQGYYIKSIGTADGLSQPNITCFHTDRKGVVWIGTRYGLNAYRAGSMHSYIDDESSSTLIQGNYVNNLFEDSEGNMWVATNKALSLLDRRSDTFRRLLSEQIYSSCEFHGKDYFGGRGKLFVYKDGKFYTISINIKGCTKDQIGSIIPVSKTRLLIVMKHGSLLQMDIRNNKIYPTSVVNQPRFIMLSAMKTTAGRIFVSVYRKGVYEITPSGMILRTYTIQNSSLTNDVILTISEKNGYLWIGSDGGGIYLLNLSSNTLTPLSSLNEFRDINFPSKSFTAIYTDGNQITWLGTVRHGVIGLRRTLVQEYKRGTMTDKTGPSNSTILDLIDDAGTLWLGTDGGGVNAYNEQTKVFRTFTPTDEMKISSLTQFDDSHLLVSVYSKGLMLFDKQSGICTPFLIFDKPTNDYEVYAGITPMVYKVNDQKIFIFSMNAYVYNLRTHQYEKFKGSEKEDKSEMHLFWLRGSKCLAYNKHAIFEINSKLNTISCIYRQHEEINTVALCDGKLWIGTNTGLCWVDLETKKQQSFKSYLFHRVTQLSNADDKQLWIGADNSLYCYQVKSKKCEIIDESDGFSSNEIISSLVNDGTSTGSQLFLGGTLGLVKIDKGVTLNKAPESSIELFDILLDGKKGSVNENGELSVKWDYSSLVISVMPVCVNPFRKTLYKYIIKGGTNSEVVTYSNELSLPALQPDDYDIEVSYLKENGSWSSSARVLSLIISPPWYRSWWFVSLLIIILISGLGVTFYYARRKYKQMERQLERQHELDNEQNRQFMLKFQRIVDENLSNPKLNVALIYQEMAMSRSAFYDRFNSINGIGAMEYVAKQRIKKACLLLETTRLPISDIAEKVGFSNQHYFSNTFKQNIGTTPRDYRNSH